MTKIIILSGKSLEDFYEETLLTLQEKFHSNPTCIPDNAISRIEIDQNSCYDFLSGNSLYQASMGRRSSPEGTGNQPRDGGIKLGRTIF